MCHFINKYYGLKERMLCLLGSEDRDAIWVKMTIRNAHSFFNCNEESHITSVQNTFNTLAT